MRAVTLSGKERLVVETPASMLVDDITRDKKVLFTVVDSRLGISALAPGAKQESDLSWFDASRVYDISADGKTICSWSCLMARRAIPPSISAKRTARRRCGWAMATGPLCRRTESLWRAF